MLLRLATRYACGVAASTAIAELSVFAPSTIALRECSAPARVEHDVRFIRENAKHNGLLAQHRTHVLSRPEPCG